MEVKKRNGSIEEFDPAKISKVIIKTSKQAKESIEEELVSKMVEYVTKEVANLKEPILVKDIRKAVENALMNFNRFDTARVYIEECRKRENAYLEGLPVYEEMVTKLSGKRNDHQNANVDEDTFGGKIGEATDIMLKNRALDFMINPKFAKLHKESKNYIHDLSRWSVGQHNCYMRETRFVTDEGIKAFKDFNDGDSVKVLNIDGNFVDATVHMYGKQYMHEVVLRKGHDVKKFKCTRDHRWVLEDGSVTEHLEAGDTLKNIPLQFIDEDSIKTKRNAEMFALGFVLGDGTDAAGNFIRVRLCGAKMQYKPFIKMGGFCSVQKIGEDEVFAKKVKTGKQSFLDSKAWTLLSPEDKTFLFAGYYAADGSTSSKYISSTDERLVEMIKDISCCAGYHIVSIKNQIKDTEYKKGVSLFTIKFESRQRDAWKVEKINYLGQLNEAWCVEEPLTKTFTLEGGILTGNCLSFPIDNITSKPSTIKVPQALRVPGGIETLCQIILVHLQSQSQDQFGGVAITHLDWTSVPFIRKSFWRFYNDCVEEYNTFTGEKLKNEVEKKDRAHTSIEDKRYKSNKKIYNVAMKKIRSATHQAVEALLHNANTLQSRSGNQLPFTSVNYGTCTLKEGQILCEELLKTWEDGIGELKLTSIFPCGIFQIKDGVNTKEGDPNYYLFKRALEVLPKRDYPNFTNCDWSVDLEGFKKSQAVKEKVLNSLTEEELRRIAKLPIEIQNKLGFTIIED